MSASSAASHARLRSLPSRTAARDDDAELFAAPRLRPSTVYACDGAEVPPYVFRSEGFAEDLGQEYGIG